MRAWVGALGLGTTWEYRGAWWPRCDGETAYVRLHYNDGPGEEGYVATAAVQARSAAGEFRAGAKAGFVPDASTLVVYVDAAFTNASGWYAQARIDREVWRLVRGTIGGASYVAVQYAGPTDGTAISEAVRAMQARSVVGEFNPATAARRATEAGVVD